MVLQRVETRRVGDRNIDVYQLQADVGGSLLLRRLPGEFDSVIEGGAFQEALEKMAAPHTYILWIRGKCYLEVTTLHELNGAPDVIEL